MKPRFAVKVTPQFERLARKLLKHIRDSANCWLRRWRSSKATRTTLPGHTAIKKLIGVPLGEGQYRIRLGRFRFRYDISRKEVWLVYCGLPPGGHLSLTIGLMR